MIKQLFSVLFLLPFSIFAQREVDLELTLTSPQNDAYQPPMEVFLVSISVKNVGNTNFLSSDSVAFYFIINGDTSLFGLENHIYFTNHPLSPGQSFPLAVSMGFDESFANQDVDLCVFVKPYSEADPVSDLQLSDNKDCALVHVMEQPVGLNPINFSSISLYPNPAHSQFNIEAGSDEIYSIVAVDMQGRRYPLNEKASIVDCSSWSNGVYGLEIISTNGMSIKKLVINNP